MNSDDHDVMAELSALDAEAAQRYSEGRYLDAVAVARQMLAIVEAEFGSEHPYVAASLNTLIRLHQALGDHAPAIPLGERALRIYENAVGPEHPEVATLLNNLAGLHHERGAYALAQPLYERALRIREAALGTDHADVAVVLNNLASVYQDTGAYARAAPLFERALRVTEKVHGVEHPDVATCANNLAMLHHDRGEYAQAEPLYQRALGIREKVLGLEDPDTASSLNNLALLYRDRGMYARALPLYERALRIREQVHGPEHGDVAASLNNLAGLLKEQGAYTRAEALYERSLVIWEKTLGAEHPGMAASLNNLAGLYQSQGAYSRAAPLYERALGILQRARGEQHPDVATCLNNLAALQRARGDHAAAARLYERALRIQENLLGPEHPAVARSLNNLAGVLQDGGAYERAEPLYERALRIHTKVLGSEHPAVATSLSNLAGLYFDRGMHDEAMSLAERALPIWESALGTDHPEIVTALVNTALVSWNAGNVSQVISRLARASAVRERLLERTLSALSEPRKREFLRSQRDEADLVASFHAHRAPDDADALELALTVTLQRKGRILEEVAREHAELRRNLSPELQADLDTLQARRVELATRRQAGDQRVDALRALTEEVERRENELSRQSTRYCSQATPLTVLSVQAALPAGATLIEFVQYRHFEVSHWPHPWREPHYIAYLLQPDGSTRHVALGRADAIDAVVATATAALAQRSPDARGALRALDALVFAPIRRTLGRVDHVLICPDAALHLVPFAALIDEDGRHLIEHTLVTYLTSGRDLVRRAPSEPPRSKPVVLAAPDYEGRYDPLPGALAEATQLRQYFPEIEVHVAKDATKDKVLRARGPLFVHAATHGLFRDPPATTASPATRPSPSMRDVVCAPRLPAPPDDRAEIEDALDDAVLVFAGRSDADAYLTAREITAVDLRGTQLVVLSACGTGVGQVAQSEGVYGLRRAVAVAGAQTQVVSLWKVDDHATSRLMDLYYRGLCHGEGRSAALRHAQLDILGDEATRDPFYWAAFVAIGEGAPLRVVAGTA